MVPIGVAVSLFISRTICMFGKLNCLFAGIAAALYLMVRYTRYQVKSGYIGFELCAYKQRAFILLVTCIKLAGE